MEWWFDWQKQKTKQNLKYLKLANSIWSQPNKTILKLIIAKCIWKEKIDVDIGTIQNGWYFHSWLFNPNIVFSTHEYMNSKPKNYLFLLASIVSRKKTLNNSGSKNSHEFGSSIITHNTMMMMMITIGL